MKTKISNSSQMKTTKSRRLRKLPSEKLQKMHEKLTHRCAKSKKRFESAQSQLILVSEELQTREQSGEVVEKSSKNDKENS